MKDEACHPDIDGYYEPDGDVVGELKSDGKNVYHVGVSKEVLDILLRCKTSEFGKHVCEVIRLSADLDACHVLEYPCNDGDFRILYFYLFGNIGCSMNYGFHEDSVDFGEGCSISTGFKCDTEASVKKIGDEFGNELYVTQIGSRGFDNSADFFFVLKCGAVFNLTKHAMSILYDPTKPDIVKRILRCVVWMEATSEKFVDYVVFDRCFHTTDLKVREQECEVGTNYNDDLPDDKINAWINSDDSGLMILHGDPGTGKTSYIRNLIYRTENRFMFFDKSLFQHMSDASLIQMLLDHRNSIIVLEDCEDLLTDRTGFGSCMSTILNLTDGILGDSLRFKFICTFNADLVDIDSAILRKGRMRLKYEFKKLTADKVVALGKKLGVEVPHEEMPLCEVYNYAEDNGGKVEEKAKVGF